MIYGIGVDVAEISRISKAWTRWGERFEKRIFTRAEVEFCLSRPRPAACLAMRFAAKEAFSKAMGIGLRSNRLLWRDIEVAHDERGKPCFLLHDTAARVVDEAGVTACHLSLTDEAGLAQAFVVAEKGAQVIN